MVRLPDPFESPKRRLRRAKVNRGRFEKRISSFLDKEPYARVVETDSEGFTIHAVKFTRNFPKSWADVAVEVFEGLRSTLDQTGYAAAVLGGIPHPKNAYFPAADNITDLDSVTKGRCRDLPREISALFRGFNAYPGGNYALWALNKLGDYPGLDRRLSARYIPSTLRERPMARRPKPVHQMTSAQFDALFVDETDCITYLIARRWPNGVRCPRCANKKVYALASGHHWQCENCTENGYRFSHIAGTIFENTNKPLRDWFKVTHLMLTSKKGMSALQIMRFMGFGSYKTAWGMCHKVRAALVEQNPDKLGGIVEVDETFIGGKAKNKHGGRSGVGGGARGKSPIIGAVQRKGNVVTRCLGAVSKFEAEQFVREVVSTKVSLLATDEALVYDDLKGFPHGRVHHAAKRYVIGAIHTNTIEGFWSIFKRSIVGSYHKVSRKYLPLYIAECQFKYNNRFNDDIFGTAIKGC